MTIENQFKPLLGWLSGVLGFIIPLGFAYTILAKGTSANLATWCMMLLVDTVGVLLVVKGGGRWPKLQSGWVLAGAIIVIAILLSKNEWHWTTFETLGSVFCMLAIAVWWKGNENQARYALWFQMLAFYIAFVPQAKDYWYSPNPGMLWFWSASALACLIAILGEKDKNFVNLFVPFGALTMDMIAIVLVIL